MPALVPGSKISSADVDVQKLESFTLRCFVYPQKGRYVAECIDLDLMAKADSPTRALDSLKEALFGYLQTVLEGDKEGLLPRRSPLSHRLRYQYYCLLAALTNRRTNFRLCDLSSDQLTSNCFG